MKTFSSDKLGLNFHSIFPSHPDCLLLPKALSKLPREFLFFTPATVNFTTFLKGGGGVEAMAIHLQSATLPLDAVRPDTPLI